MQEIGPNFKRRRKREIKGGKKKETEETLSLEVLRRVIFGKALVCIQGLQHLTMRVAPLEGDTLKSAVIASSFRQLRNPSSSAEE